MSRLQEILAHKRFEVDRLGPAPASSFVPRPLALRRSAPGPLRLICEIKRRSPSAGQLSTALGVGQRARLYEHGGASMISVLTDAKYFDGAFAHLSEARAATSTPHPVQRLRDRRGSARLGASPGRRRGAVDRALPRSRTADEVARRRSDSWADAARRSRDRSRGRAGLRPGGRPDRRERSGSRQPTDGSGPRPAHRRGTLAGGHPGAPLGGEERRRRA